VYTQPSMGVRAVISANSLEVQPGASAVVTVTVRNTGAVVDHFHVDVLGDAMSWATITPATLVTLTPLASTPPAISHRESGVTR